MSKWRDDCGVKLLFGEVAGFTVCVARRPCDTRGDGFVGLSFCNPKDRFTWDRAKGKKIALNRANSGDKCLIYNESFTLQDYVTQATYSVDYVPKDVADTVRANVRNLCK